MSVFLFLKFDVAFNHHTNFIESKITSIRLVLYSFKECMPSANNVLIAPLRALC